VLDAGRLAHARRDIALLPDPPHLKPMASL
jgi:hypothetical protein